MKKLLVLLSLWLASTLVVGQTYFPMTTSASQITTDLQVSRTSCVAPCQVHFDLTGTLSTLTSDPYHQIDYTCTFDDAAGGAAFTTGTRTDSGSKNVGYGPLQAHLYESDGTFNPLCTGRYSSTTGTDGATITVTAADTQWKGTATLCVRQTAGGSFTGCPSGADQVTDADFDNVVNTRAGNGATYKRILFECDGTYTVAGSSATINVSGPGYIGAYPVGCSGRAKPIVAGTITKLILGASANPSFNDWRVVDLQFSGSGGVGSCISATTGTTTNVSLIRVDCDGANDGISFTINNFDALNNPVVTNPVHSLFGIFYSNITNSDDYNIFGASSKFMLVGSTLDGTSGEHGIRTQWTEKAVISNNDLLEAFKTSLTLRGIVYTQANRVGAYALGRYTFGDQIYTQYTYVGENVITGSTTASFPVSLVPVDDIADARFRYTIFANNWLTLGTGASTITGMQFLGSSMTIRNNLLDLTGANAGQQGFVINASSTQMTSDSIYIYNNTVFSNKTSSAIFVTLGETSFGNPTNVIGTNNLGVAPNNTSGSTAFSSGTWGTGSDFTHTNSSGAQIKGASPLSTTPPTTPANYQPTGGSYPVDGGTSVPVWRDFFQVLRSGTYDIGAVNP